MNRSPALDAGQQAALRELANRDAAAGHVGAAASDFRKLVGSAPTDSESWQSLGLLYIRLKQYDRSLDALQRAASLNPQDVLTQRTLGFLALRSGHLHQAQNSLQRVIAENPTDPVALAALAGVSVRTDPSLAGLAGAEKLATRSIRSRPTAEGYSTRGQIRMTLGQYAGAIQDLKESIALDPDRRFVYLLLSQCYASSGQPRLAAEISAAWQRRAAQLARETNPGSPAP